MEETEKLTWDFLHLAKLGAYYTIAPYQILQRAANAPDAFLQHFFSKVGQGLSMEKNYFPDVFAAHHVFRYLFAGVK